MRIKFLSGEQAGVIKDVPEAEGEALVTSGAAEMVPYGHPAAENTAANTTSKRRERRTARKTAARKR